MISDLNSFFEVTFALYASLCVDEKLGVNIWLPKISPSLTFFLTKEPIWKELELDKTITSIVNGKIKNARSRFRLLGMNMLFFNAAFLVYSAYFGGCTSGGAGKISYLPEMEIGAFFVINALGLLRRMELVNRLLIDMLIFLSLIAICYFNRYYVNMLAGREKVFMSFLLLLVVAPLLLASFWKIMVKKKYFVHIERILRKEISSLKKVKLCLDGQITKVDDNFVKEMPDEYKNFIIHRYGSRNIQEDEERSEDVLAGIFKSRFQKECMEPTAFALVWDCLKYRDKNIQLNDEDFEVPMMK